MLGCDHEPAGDVAAAVAAAGFGTVNKAEDEADADADVVVSTKRSATVCRSFGSKKILFASDSLVFSHRQSEDDGWARAKA